MYTSFLFSFSFFCSRKGGGGGKLRGGFGLVWGRLIRVCHLGFYLKKRMGGGTFLHPWDFFFFFWGGAPGD